MQPSSEDATPQIYGRPLATNDTVAKSATPVVSTRERRETKLAVAGQACTRKVAPMHKTEPMGWRARVDTGGSLRRST